MAGPVDAYRASCVYLQVRIGYGPPPNVFKWTVDKNYEGDVTEVPLDTPVDDSVRAGFLGSQSRSKESKYIDKKGNVRRGGFRYVSINLEEEESPPPAVTG